MNREQLTKIVSLYQEDIKDLHVDYDSSSTTIIVSDRNITAVFIGDELDDGLVHEVLNHVIGIDYDDTEDDIFRVAISDELTIDVEEKINVMSNAATLTATAEINGMDIELYSMFVVGSRRGIKIMNTTRVDSISRFDPWVIPELKYSDVPDMVANDLADMKHLTPDNFRKIEFLNGSKSDIENCIELVEKEGGELFCIVSVVEKRCVYGYRNYSVISNTLVNYLEFHSKW